MEFVNGYFSFRLGMNGRVTLMPLIVFVSRCMGVIAGIGGIYIHFTSAALLPENSVTALQGS